MGDIGSGLQMFGQNIAAGFEDIQKKQAQQQAVMGLFQMATQMQIPDPNDPSKMLPAVDKKFQEAFLRMNREQQAGMKGYLQSHIEMADTYQRMIYAKALEDRDKVQVPYGGGTVPVSPTTAVTQAAEAPQRAAQLEATKASTERTKQIIKQAGEEAGKVNVPGYGPMTPPQLSVHNARMERLDVLKQRTDPMRQFENKLQTDYGLGMADIVDAANSHFPVKNPDGTIKFDDQNNVMLYKGVPFVDAAGGQVTAEKEGKQRGKLIGPDGKDIEYDPKNPNVWAVVGPNQAHIPVHEWSQAVAKSQSFLPKMQKLQDEQTQLTQDLKTTQAQNTMAYFKQLGKDPSQYTPEEQAAYDEAKRRLGQ